MGAPPAWPGPVGHATDAPRLTHPVEPPRSLSTSAAGILRAAMATYDAVLIVSFGGPEGPGDVMEFLRNVTNGKDVPESRLEEVASRYHGIGGVSPINGQCRRIVAALENELTDHGLQLPVYWGNRNWQPMLTDTVAKMADDGVEHALAIATSAYSSYSGCRQYLGDIAAARASVGASAPRVDKVRAYFNHPGFIEPFTEATAAARAELGDLGPSAHIVFTAHSIPMAMAATCDYRSQLTEAAKIVMSLQDVGHEWSQAWQSRSGPASAQWLEPDVNDHLRTLATNGVEAVIIVPIGFVSDHMEVVYDLGVEAAATAADLGLALCRADTPGTAPHPRFVTMLRELVEERLDPGRPRLTLGTTPVRPDRCAPDCCQPNRA